MQEFFPEIDLREDQADGIALGLYAVARADSQVHEREAALIGQFFASTSAESAAAKLGALDRAPKIEGSTLAELLPAPQLRHLFIKTALLLAYIDSVLEPGEKALIEEYATALGVSPADLTLMETQVKEYLLSHLSHLTNVEAAADVARELKL